MFRVFNTPQFDSVDGTPFQVPDGEGTKTPTLAEWLSLLLSSWMNGPGQGRFTEVVAARTRTLFHVFHTVKPGELIELDEDHAKWLRDVLFGEQANHVIRHPQTGEEIAKVTGPWGYNFYGPMAGLAISDAFKGE